MKNKKNNTTELVFILDKSGSMNGLEQDTIGGFNSMLNKQKKEKGECFVTTILFDNEISVVHDKINIKDVPELTEETYFVGGCTALIDALGFAINNSMRKDSNSSLKNTMFVIITDGMENASKEYTSDQVKKMVEQQKAAGWEFIFIGANIDAVETAKHYGINSDRAINYMHDKQGTKAVYESVGNAVGSIRKNKNITAECFNEVSKDYETRNKKG